MAEHAQRVSADAVGLLVGYVVDAAVGDPRRFHPVAGFGEAARLYVRCRRADITVYSAIDCSGKNSSTCSS